MGIAQNFINFVQYMFKTGQMSEARTRDFLWRVMPLHLIDSFLK